MLRNHLTSAAKYQQQMHAINLSDPDTLQRHLDTRYYQLNVAVELELWQEAFRSVEDLQTLMSLTKRQVKPIALANYYEQLTKIFLVSENYLFHAAAWSRLYNLYKQSQAAAQTASSKKDSPVVTDADMTRTAAFCILSALSVPVISTSRSRGVLDGDETRKNKTQRLTNLLGMSTAPTRTILFKDAMNKGLLKRVQPEIRDLYYILERDFHPLSIVSKVSPILLKIAADNDMAKYIQPLQQVILTRLFQQLSQVYESVELSFVHKLAQFPEGFQVSKGDLEKFLLNACKKGDLALRLDHASGVLTFDSDVFSSAKALHPGSAAGSAEGPEATSVQRLQRTPAEIVRSQLVRLAKVLYTTCQYVDPSFNAARQEAKAVAFQRAAEGAEQEHQTTLARRAIIEKKKELASEAQQKKQREEETRKKLQAQQLLEKEQERLREQQVLRDRKRLEEQQRKARVETLTAEVEELKKHRGLNLENIDIDELDSDKLRSMRIEQMTKEKNEMNKVLQITGKRIDHIERAFRKEEVQLLPADYETQRERDLANYEATKAESLKNAEQKHKEDVALKHRLGRLVTTYEQFRNDLQERRHDQFERRRKQADRELENAIQKRKRDVKEKRARERREKEDAERRQREEEERVAREAEEKAAAEAERKRKMAEEKAARDKERKELEDVAAKQRQREAEAEARAQARKTGTGAGAGAGAGTGAGTGRLPERSAPVRAEAEKPAGPPVIALAGSKPSWRERQAAKEAAAATGASAPAPAETEAEAPPAPTEPAKKGGYVPPHLRGRQDGQLPPAGARDDSTGAEKWRRREVPRDGSPADVPTGRGSPRPANGPPATDGATKPPPGKYVPPSMRNKS